MAIITKLIKNNSIYEMHGNLTYCEAEYNELSLTGKNMFAFKRLVAICEKIKENNLKLFILTKKRPVN